jgi:hypothetical protein
MFAGEGSVEDLGGAGRGAPWWIVAARAAAAQVGHRPTFLPDRYFMRPQEVVVDPADADTVFVMTTEWRFAPDGRTRNEFVPRL